MKKYCESLRDTANESGLIVKLIIIPPKNVNMNKVNILIFLYPMTTLCKELKKPIADMLIIIKIFQCSKANATLKKDVVNKLKRTK